MVEIKWTNFAIQNLNDIGDYIEQHSYRQASKMVNYLFDSVSILETFPLSGRIVPEYDTYHVRELIRSNYRIIQHNYYPIYPFSITTASCPRNSKNGIHALRHNHKYFSSLLLQKRISATATCFSADGS